MIPGPRFNIDQFIVDIGRHVRHPTGQDLEILRLHVAQAGFDSQQTFSADRRVDGLRRANGQIIQIGDQIANDELHHLRHVVARAEWPIATSQRQYEASLRELASRLRVGILVSEHGLFGWQVAVVGRSGRWQGPSGFEWMLVEYRVSTGHWATGHQLRDGLAFANERGRKRWLRLPT